MERIWNSAAGGLYFSLILLPKFGPKRLADFSLAAASAAADAIKELTELEPVVKPPNDVFIFADNRAVKVCGILAEARGDSKTLDWLVLGVGINVNNDPDAKNASSLKALTGRVWDAEAVLKIYLAKLRKKIRTL
jgi:BirA family biotin operon repressor/biotin-[acetyl-CoA-carboxylase] ligase